MQTRAEVIPFRYCGRSFTHAEIETIRGISEDPRYATRAEITRAVCAALAWVKPDGLPKVVSCHVALQRMEAHGVIWLPLPTREAVRPRPHPGTPRPASRRRRSSAPAVTSRRCV